MIDEATATSEPQQTTATSESEATPAAQVETPKPAPAEEKLDPPPSWVTARLDTPPLGPSQQSYAPPPQQPQPYYPPQPPFYPQPPPQQAFGPAPNRPLTVDDLGRDIDGSIRGAARQEIMAAVMPLLQQTAAQQARLAQLDEFGRRQHEDAVVSRFGRAQSFVNERVYGQFVNSEPALSHPTVRKRFDQYVTQYMASQFRAAADGGAYQALDEASTIRPYKLAAALAKEDAGWSDTGKRIEIKGAFVESSRSMPQGSASLTEDERAAAKYLGMSDDEYAKEKVASQKRGGR